MVNFFHNKTPISADNLSESKLISVAHHLEREVYNAIKKTDREKETIARRVLGAVLERIYSESNTEICNFFAGSFLDHSATQSAVYGVDKHEISDLESKIRATYPMDCTPFLVQTGASPINFIMPNRMPSEEADALRNKGKEMLSLFISRNSIEILSNNVRK
jgi:hypothetical protein